MIVSRNSNETDENLTREEELIFCDFPAEFVSFHKPNGELICEKAKVLFTGRSVLLANMSFAFCEGDYLERRLPNNRKEFYEIIDVGYHREFDPMLPEHYQMKVKKIYSPVL